MIWPFTQSTREVALQEQLAAERSSHDATKRLLTVTQAEVEALAGVIARDRMRVASETALFARHKAEAESDHNGRPQ